MANGISVKDQILFARIAAKSGMNIITVRSLGENRAAWYDGRSSIYLDASAPRTRSFKALLGHEMWHKVFKSARSKRLFMQAWNNIDRAKRDSVIDQYMAEEQRQGRRLPESAEVSAEEVAAAYAEELFNVPNVWDFVLGEEPSLKDRVIAFFQGAPGRYSFAPEMDPAARAWLREYKKLFDQVARLNAGMNVAENVGASDKVIKVLGRLAEDEKTPAATQVPEKVIKKIGKLVPDNTLEPNNSTFGSYDNKTTVSNNVKTTNKKPLTNMKKKNMQVSGGRAAIHYPEFAEKDIEANINYIASMNPVKIINATKLEKTGKAPKEIFREYFESLGNSIYSPIYGDIALGNSSVKSEIRHGVTAEKIASIEAIPDVIEKGKVIFFENKTGSDNRVKRIVIAAPIKIANTPYYMGVMLQRDPSTQYLYLHNVTIEKEMDKSSRAHLVTTGADEQSSHLSMSIILQNAIDVKLNNEKILADSSEALDTLTKPQALSLIQRGVKGDDLLNSADLASEILSVGGKITTDAKAVLYHGTTKQNADNIRATGTMYGKEDGLFFSTKRDGLVLDYGKNVVEVKIPLEKLILDDIFDDEAHLRIPVKQFKYTDVEVTKESFDSGERSALSDGQKVTSSEVAAVKRAISDAGVDPRGIISVADRYFGRYDGELTRTGMRYEFLSAAELLFDPSEGSVDK